MTLFFKFDFNAICQIVLEQTLKDNDIKYKLVGFGEIEVLEKLTSDKQATLQAALDKYQIEIVENQKSILVQKIKDTIIE